MSTDLEQLGKELALVQRREVDPFAEPLPEPEIREITNEQEAPSDGDFFGVRHLVSDEELARFAGNPEMLIIELYGQMCMELSKRMARDGFCVDPASVVFDRHAEDILRSYQVLGVKTRGRKTLAPSPNTVDELVQLNNKHLSKAFLQIVNMR